MTEWKNIGDINPSSGTTLIRNPEINRNGDFEVEMIKVIPETAVGGDDQRFLLQIGAGFLAAKNFASALDTIGATIDPATHEISMPGYNLDTIIEAKGSDAWFRTMAHACDAYGAIDPDITSLVQIGEDQPYSQDRKFDGEITIFSEGSGLWSIIERELELGDEGLGFAHNHAPAVMLEHDEAPCP